MLRPASQGLLRVASQSTGGSVRHAGHSGYVPSPPMVRISFAEKVCHGLVISLGFMAYPMYAIVDVRQRRLKSWAEES